MKGLTPVISLILLLLIVVVIVGVAAGQLIGIFTTATSGVQKGVGDVSNRISKIVSLDSVSCRDDTTLSLAVKSIGSSDIKKNELYVYMNNQLIGNFLDDVPSGQVVSDTITVPNCQTGDIVKVSGPVNSDEKTIA